MTYPEAVEWIKGNRSMVNVVPYDPLNWQSRIAEADAFMTQQAYWVLKAHAENIVPTENLNERRNRLFDKP